MKAVRLHKHGGPEVLVYEDVPDPSPGPGEILIRVEAVGVNFADTMRRQNSPLYPYPSPPPFTPGGEVAGVVERIGPGVQSPEVGTRVFAFVGVGGSTGYAQYAVANASQAIPIPPELDSIRACTLLVAGLTAVLTIQESAQLQAGESVLVQAAAGGVGSYALQLAKLFGAGTVIGAASTPEKRDLARRLGADHVVDYTKNGWSEDVRAITGGRGVDVVLEMTGGSVFRRSLDCLAPFGRCVVYGLAGPEPGSLQPTELLALNHSLVGFYLGSWFEHRPEKAVAALQLLIGHVLTGRIEVQIDRVLPLAQAAEAHRLLEGRATMGKLVLEPWAED